MQNGIFILYKPINQTSMDIIRKIKRKFNLKKVGHAGTLDPMADGVLPILVGEATKFVHLLHDGWKEYEFTVKFGIETDSMDSAGEVTGNTDFIPTQESMESVIPNFKGTIDQVPPKFSACKVNGKRAYDLARNSVDFQLNAKKVDIHELKITDYSNPLCSFLCKCGSGTYIRSLATDMAKSANSICYVTKLTRTKYWHFPIEKSKSLEDIAEQDFIKLESINWENTINLDEDQYNHVKHGRNSTADKQNGTYVGIFQDKIIGILKCAEGILSAQRMLI